MLTITLPFSIDALQSAVRRYMHVPALSIEEVVPERLSGGISGSPVYKLRVSYRGTPDDCIDAGSVISLILKRGSDHKGAILQGSARREASFYRTLAQQMPVRTPRLLLTADDIAGEHDTALVVHASSSLVQGWEGLSFDSEWVLMEALPSEIASPQSSWRAEHYKIALTALADLHAGWWGHPPDPTDYPWVWMPTGHHTAGLIKEAREALLQIGEASWGESFFPKERLRAWLRLLDDPEPLFKMLSGMPQTLIHGDYWPGNISMQKDGPAVYDWQFVGVGPAPYDLACFHSSSRWWFGRLPMSLMEMRNHYLERLNEKLDKKVDRYSFDVGMDAARAWRFAVLWPTVIVEHHAGLQCSLQHTRSTAIEPAFASLRRCLGYVEA